MIELKKSLDILWDRFLVPVDDPGSRLFYLNILMTLLLMTGFYYLRGARNLSQICSCIKRDVLNKKYWWNRSTKQDYKIYFLNSILKVLIFIPFLDISYKIATGLARYLVELNGGEFLAFPSSFYSLGLFTVFAFVFDDFARFFVHWVSHRFEFLWRLHSVHHSAKVLTPITLFRSHPVESAFSTLRNAFTMGVSTGLFIFIFQSPMSVFTLLGINIFGFVFNLLGSNLRHSQIPLEFGSLEKIFISPRMHQIHHSVRHEHWDKNLGVSLSIWDRLFGTVIYSKDIQGIKLRFGIK